MMTKTLTSKRVWLPVLVAGIVVLLASWDYQQKPVEYKNDQQPTDTIPKKKKAVSDKKVRDLDDVLDELDAVDMEKEMKKVHEELSKAMKEIDLQKMQLDLEKSFKEIDMAKIKDEIDKAMKEVDMAKIKKEVEESMAKIDWDKIKKDMEEVRNIDFSKMEAEMKAAREELEKIKPQLEKEMANVKEELQKAKGEIEKAKVEIREYKEFVDGLDKDGLINKKEEYTIRHEDGVLTINGKKAADNVYSKYRSFLENHKKFNIKKTADDFDIDMDND